MNNPQNFPCQCGFKNGVWKPKKVYIIEPLVMENGFPIRTRVTCKKCGKVVYLSDD